MSLIVVRATFECDGCGGQFKVDMDAATMRPKGWSLMEEAEDCVRGGCGSDGGMPAIVHGMHLCHDCAEIAAGVGPAEGGYAPKPEIEAALARADNKRSAQQRSGDDRG